MNDRIVIECNSLAVVVGGNGRELYRSVMMENEKFASQEIFLFGEPEGFFEAFVQFDSVEGPVRSSLLTFKANLLSAILVGNVPYRLVHSSVLGARYNQIRTAESIRTLKIVPGVSLDEEARRQLAERVANEKMDAELKDPEVIVNLAKQTLKVLDQHLAEEEFRISAQELLRQVLVICWGAFEILTDNILRVVMNERPAIVRTFAAAKRYRDILTGQTLLDALEENGFNLSSKMGDLFCDLARFDSLEKIREAIHLSLADPSIDTFLKDERLWRIAEQRHLIIHRRGLIDAYYVTHTSERATIGDQITFEASYIESCLALVRDIGCKLLRAAQERLIETTGAPFRDATRTTFN